MAMASGSNRILIRHSCVSNNSVILVSHQTEPENYSPMIYSVLGALQREEKKKFTFPVESFQVHVLVEDGLVYSCITYKTDKHYVPFTFLETVKNKFCDIPSLVNRSRHASEHEFDRDFGPVLASTVYDFNIGRGDKVSQLQAQVDDVKQIMLENVEKVIDRGEKLDDLLSKTEDLESHGSGFRQRAREIHIKARCRNIRMWLIIGAILTTVLTIAILLASGVIHL